MVVNIKGTQVHFPMRACTFLICRPCVRVHACMRAVHLPLYHRRRPQALKACIHVTLGLLLRWETQSPRETTQSRRRGSTFGNTRGWHGKVQAITSHDVVGLLVVVVDDHRTAPLFAASAAETTSFLQSFPATLIRTPCISYNGRFY